MSYGFTITNQGIELITSLLSGETLNITKVMVGEGRLPDHVNPAEITDLVASKALAATSVPIASNSKVSFIVEYRSDLNGGLEEGFWINEFGIFAKNKENEEILLYYATLGDYPQYINKYVQGAVDVRRYPVAIILSTDNEVSISYPANAFVTSEEVQALFEEFGGGEKLQAHLDNEEIHVSETDRQKWDSKANASDLSVHSNLLVNSTEGVHGIKIQDGIIQYQNNEQWETIDTGKDDILFSVSELKNIIGSPNPTDTNKNSVMNFLNLINSGDNDKTDLVLAQTLTQMINVPSLEFAVTEMNRTARFGKILRRAYGLNSEIMDSLNTIEDVVNDSDAVTEMISNQYCKEMIDSCPLFLSAMEQGPAYIESITGTLEGIAYLKNNYESMKYIVNSPIWQAAFIRNSEISYKVLEDERWNHDFLRLTGTEAEVLFKTDEWYNFIDNNIAAFKYMVDLTSNIKKQPFSLFFNTVSRFKKILDTNVKIEYIIQNKAVSKLFFTENINDDYGKAVIDTVNYNKLISSSIAMETILSVEPYITKINNSSVWARNLADDSQGSAVFASNIIAVAGYASNPQNIKELARGAGVKLLQAVINNHFNLLLSAVKNTAYFSASAKSIEMSSIDVNDGDMLFHYNGSSNGFAIMTSIFVKKMNDTHNQYEVGYTHTMTAPKQATRGYKAGTVAITTSRTADRTYNFTADSNITNNRFSINPVARRWANGFYASDSVLHFTEYIPK